MVRLPHQRDDDDTEDRDAGTEDEAPTDETDDEDEDDPIKAIFRIIEKYYEGVAKREDEGMGVG